MIKEPPIRGNGSASPEAVDPTTPVQPRLPPATTLRAAQTAELTPDERAANQKTMLRIEQLPRETGWALITAGVVGLIMPGIPGAPFLLAGAVVLTPGGSRRLSRWIGHKPPKVVHSGVRQIGRFLDDLERRYPRRATPSR